MRSDELVPIDYDPTDFDGERLPPYQHHSATSKAAAEAIKPSRVTLRTQVLNFLRNRRGTDEQIQNGLEMNPSTQRPRRIELVGLGLVRDSKLLGWTESGRRATVWEAVPESELKERTMSALKQAELPL